MIGTIKVQPVPFVNQSVILVPQGKNQTAAIQNYLKCFYSPTFPDPTYTKLCKEKFSFAQVKNEITKALNSGGTGPEGSVSTSFWGHLGYIWCRVAEAAAGETDGNKIHESCKSWLLS